MESVENTSRCGPGRESRNERKIATGSRIIFPLHHRCFPIATLVSTYITYCSVILIRRRTRVHMWSRTAYRLDLFFETGCALNF
jgi:hypothetical protein